MRRTTAFSLLELVVAVAILAVVLVPYIQSMLSSRRGLIASVEEVLATAEAARILEVLKRVPFDDLPVSIEEQPVPHGSWDDQHFAWPQGQGTAPAASPDRPPSAVLALAAPTAKDALVRLLAITLVPVEFPGSPCRYLKLIDVRVSCPRPGGTDDASTMAALTTLVSPAP